MRSTNLLMMILLSLSFPVLSGEPSSRVSMNNDLLQKIRHADAAKGLELSSSCAACHDAGGSFPALDGQLPTYLFKQLQDYKDGHRENPMMTALASTLSDEDRVNLAAHYGHLPLKKAASPKASRIPTLVNEGDSRRILPPCAACHNSDGSGQKIDVPALRGQNEAYLVQTLKDYKSGTRHNDLYGRMRSIAAEMTDEEILEAAHYYGGLN